MFNAINSSMMNNFTTVQELSRTPENTQGQQNISQGSRTQRVLMKKSPWGSRTSGNLISNETVLAVQNSCFIPTA